MHSPPNRFVAGLLALALALSSATALAEPSAVDKETARSLMAEGRKKRETGDHKGALESFKAADAIMSVPTTGLEVGRTQVDLGLLLEARDTLLNVARGAPKPGEPASFVEARAEAQTSADAIAPRIPSIKLVLTGIAEGATVKVAIDGVEISASTLGIPRKVNPGTHVVAVTVSGVEKKTTVEVAEKETKEAALDFADAKKAPGPDPIPKDDKPTSDTKTNPLFFVGVGVGGAGLIVGAITGLMHLSKTSSLKDACPNGKCPPSAFADYDSAKTLSTVSTVSFVVAAVGVGVGIYGLLSPTRVEGKPASGKAHVTPWIGLGMAGLSGSF